MERTGIDILIAHWNTTLNGVRLQPSVFYETVENELAQRQIPNLSITRVFLRESGLFSARREYLRVRQGNLIFDICGFPAADSFTVSWWLGAVEKTVGNLFFEIPLIGKFLEERLNPATYFEIDVEATLQRTVHTSVLRIVDELTDQNELPKLAGREHEPILTEFYE